MVQRSASASGDLFCKPPLSCCQRKLDPAGHRGIAGQSTCLVNRRSWVRIPAMPLNLWLCSAGSFLDRRPWQCLCFSNCIPIVQRPKDLVLPTHRARNLTLMDWHKEENFSWGSVALHATCRSWLFIVMTANHVPDCNHETYVIANQCSYRIRDSS